jgi:S-formylglutathione hydrolase
MNCIENRACFGGHQQVWRHASTSTNCEMNFAIYLPPGIDKVELDVLPRQNQRAMPVLYWLSGLTCTEQNFITKAGAQRYAAEHGVVLVVPDTSPRGIAVATGPSYDLGLGAGFYVNATQQPWAQHYRMYDYIVHELPQLIENHFNVSQKRSIFGHSMGGHGALMIALRNPGRYASVSAFAPIVAPSQVPWGQKAFENYLGTDQKSWRDYDSVALIEKAPERLELLIDQGDADEFLGKSLTPELLRAACLKHGHPLQLNMRKGYDHSYYFVASFIGEHIAHHARALHSAL